MFASCDTTADESSVQYDEEFGMGCVLSWGNNEYGQLGREIDTEASETGYGRYSHEMYPCVQFSDDTNRITLIACGDLHCLALARDGIQVITTF